MTRLRPIEITRHALFALLLLLTAACSGQPSSTLTVVYLRTPSPGPSTPTPFQVAQTPKTDTPTFVTATEVDPTLLSSATITDTSTPGATAVRIPVIEYHYTEYNVSNQVMMTTGWFENQMAWLSANGFTTLSAADLVDFLNGKSFPEKSVVLSFDLGTARETDFSTIIVPTLQKYGFKALFFLLVNSGVITDTCDKSGKFCWDELLQWQNEGIASMESHGLTHPNYATLTPTQMRWDAGQAKTIITAKLGVTPLGFAYPYDSVPAQAPKVIQSVGYEFAVGGYQRSDRSVHLSDTDRYALPRLYPYSNTSIYPIIGGSNGKTYDQLVLSAIGQLNASQASAPTPGSSPTKATTPLK